MKSSAIDVVASWRRGVMDDLLALNTEYSECQHTGAIYRSLSLELANTLVKYSNGMQCYTRLCLIQKFGSEKSRRVLCGGRNGSENGRTVHQY